MIYAAVTVPNWNKRGYRYGGSKKEERYSKGRKARRGECKIREVWERKGAVVETNERNKRTERRVGIYGSILS
jgi:hypothetical protein